MNELTIILGLIVGFRTVGRQTPIIQIVAFWFG